jgi:hypothetical protein
MCEGISEKPSFLRDARRPFFSKTLVIYCIILRKIWLSRTFGGLSDNQVIRIALAL